jgi:tetratricopeptide (TPR) repeat protein
MRFLSAARLHLAPVAALLALALASPPARAEGGRPPSDPSPMPSLPTERQPTPEEKALMDRREAEGMYASAWKDVQKARAEMAEAESLLAFTDSKVPEKAKKKSDSATKRLRRSADQFEAATKLSPDYHEAWNMLGYCWRKLGDQQKALQAYWECLRLAPDYAPAHEYLGEAYLQSGNLAKAKDELAWLDAKKAAEAESLRKSIAVYEKEHPQPEAAKASTGGSN